MWGNNLSKLKVRTMPVIRSQRQLYLGLKQLQYMKKWFSSRCCCCGYEHNIWWSVFLVLLLPSSWQPLCFSCNKLLCLLDCTLSQLSVHGNRERVVWTVSSTNQTVFLESRIKNVSFLLRVGQSWISSAHVSDVTNIWFPNGVGYQHSFESLNTKPRYKRERPSHNRQHLLSMLIKSCSARGRSELFPQHYKIKS